jgi:hypothetical protein
MWAELGAVVGERLHPDVVLDLEPIIALTDLVADRDEELDDHVGQWVGENHRWIDQARLRAIARDNTSPRVVHRLVGTRGAKKKLDPTRPALVLFRARALYGVGIRAHVMLRLAVGPVAWAAVQELSDEAAASVRAVRACLESLRRAGSLRSDRLGRLTMYELRHREAIRTTLEPLPERWFAWRPAFEVVRRLLAEIGALPREPEADVTVHRMRALLHEPAKRCGLGDAWSIDAREPWGSFARWAISVTDSLIDVAGARFAER